MNRWIISLGRAGTVLLAVGLALLLVSLIPAVQMSASAEVTMDMHPKTIDFRFSGPVLTPQYGLRVNATTNGTLNVYILEVSAETIYSWMMEHYPEPIDYWNTTHFEGFLEANQQSIGRQDVVQNGEYTYEYVPTKVTNATLVFSNPSSHVIHLEYKVSVTGMLAPVSKVRILAQWAIPIGFVLAIPWFIEFWRTKTKRRGSHLITESTSDRPEPTKL